MDTTLFFALITCVIFTIAGMYLLDTELKNLALAMSSYKLERIDIKFGLGVGVGWEDEVARLTIVTARTMRGVRGLLYTSAAALFLYVLVNVMNTWP